MSQPMTTRLTGRNMLIAFVALAALLAAAGVAVNAHRGKPLTTNAVGSASSDLAAGATAH
ncbi:MAG TPA: hypothetical protein VNW53_00795 [Phenylobacterium sp.]|jgi:hypothetical protein|uniref:hypothetical protein n=1 Tax=Phenylobacterium sp. TaxID=1871053 RepID=UPI002C117C17|nr:hypothetical protein [Phenylobacterium sp.]HXA37511.1 hypothetical protein [Phenylobacterium sp.]